MSSNSKYSLWFENKSGESGQVLLYHREDNILSPRRLQPLAWKMTGANGATKVKFTWTIDYCFVWRKNMPIEIMEIEPANLDTLNTIMLKHNTFGYYFEKQPSRGEPGTLFVGCDSSIPADDSDVFVGVGMDNSGTFAFPPEPNIYIPITPSSSLSYCISFGQYDFDVNEPIENVKNSAVIEFHQEGVYSMTATFNDKGHWEIRPGEPDCPGVNHCPD